MLQVMTENVHWVFVLFVVGVAVFHGSVYYIKVTKAPNIKGFEKTYKKTFAYDPKWKTKLLLIIALIILLLLIFNNINNFTLLINNFISFALLFLLALGIQMLFSGIGLLLAVFPFYKEGDTAVETNLKVNLFLIISGIPFIVLFLFTRDGVILLTSLVLLFVGLFGYFNIKRIVKKRKRMLENGEIYEDNQPQDLVDSRVDPNNRTSQTLTNRLGGAVSHVLPLLPLPFGNIILTLIYWAIVRTQSDYMDHHGRQSLNFQISFTLYPIIITVIWYVFSLVNNWLSDGTGPDLLGLMVGIVGVSFFIVFFVLYGALAIIAIISALLGKKFTYPMTIKFFK
ncbi:DUF4870 domain-containing protein [Evansella tamaricis]|uniref:DUF4870 domain-containing protein n=1 Tax=Evansella tamaricis TaxID=2069301 RepID=A0ABS6JDF7_9BACI|nr:DUF4870 domain-containing protein [Evansella tamaricis]MBU9711681.1 DUF4870 domain-containing protein [Evansella tamaricis]